MFSLELCWEAQYWLSSQHSYRTHLKSGQLFRLLYQHHPIFLSTMYRIEPWWWLGLGYSIPIKVSWSLSWSGCTSFLVSVPVITIRSGGFIDSKSTVFSLNLQGQNLPEKKPWKLRYEIVDTAEILESQFWWILSWWWPTALSHLWSFHLDSYTLSSYGQSGGTRCCTWIG